VRRSVASCAAHCEDPHDSALTDVDDNGSDKDAFDDSDNGDHYRPDAEDESERHDSPTSQKMSKKMIIILTLRLSSSSAVGCVYLSSKFASSLR
jgi:hypothetical protein